MDPNDPTQPQDPQFVAPGGSSDTTSSDAATGNTDTTPSPVPSAVVSGVDSSTDPQVGDNPTQIYGPQSNVWQIVNSYVTQHGDVTGEPSLVDPTIKTTDPNTGRATTAPNPNPFYLYTFTDGSKLVIDSQARIGKGTQVKAKTAGSAKPSPTANLDQVTDPNTNAVVALRDPATGKSIALPHPGASTMSKIVSGANGQKFVFDPTHPTAQLTDVSPASATAAADAAANKTDAQTALDKGREALVSAQTQLAQDRADLAAETDPARQQLLQAQVSKDQLQAQKLDLQNQLAAETDPIKAQKLQAQVDTLDLKMRQTTSTMNRPVAITTNTDAPYLVNLVPDGQGGWTFQNVPNPNRLTVDQAVMGHLFPQLQSKLGTGDGQIGLSEAKDLASMAVQSMQADVADRTQRQQAQYQQADVALRQQTQNLAEATASGVMPNGQPTEQARSAAATEALTAAQGVNAQRQQAESILQNRGTLAGSLANQQAGTASGLMSQIKQLPSNFKFTPYQNAIGMATQLGGGPDVMSRAQSMLAGTPLAGNDQVSQTFAAAMAHYKQMTGKDWTPGSSAQAGQAPFGGSGPSSPVSAAQSAIANAVPTTANPVAPPMPAVPPLGSPTGPIMPGTPPPPSVNIPFGLGANPYDPNVAAGMNPGAQPANPFDPNVAAGVQVPY